MKKGSFSIMKKKKLILVVSVNFLGVGRKILIIINPGKDPI